MSPMDKHPWERDGEAPWELPDSPWESADSEAWRGTMHANDWPENLAGPEYWLNKPDEDEE